MKFSTALIVSLAIHGVIASAIGWLMVSLPAPEITATLELSSIELSLAEKDVETERPRLSAAATGMPSANDPLPLPPQPAELKDTTLVEQKIAPSPSSECAAAVEAPQQARIDVPPKPRRKLRPKYPKLSRLRGEEGATVVEIEVAASGEVVSAKVVASSGYAALDAEAVRAVKLARFAPAKTGDTAVDSVVRLTIDFKLK